MAKQADVEFRIRSKNLSAKTIKEVTQELNELIDTQERQRATAAASSSVIAGLQADYKKLGTALESVKQAQRAAQALDKNEQQFRELREEIKSTIGELDRLRKGQWFGRESGLVPKELTKNIKTLEKELGGLMGRARTMANAIKEQRGELSALGVDARSGAAALQQVSRVNDTIVVAQVRTTQAINEATAAMSRQERQSEELAASHKSARAALAETVIAQQRLEQSSREAIVAEMRRASLGDQQVRQRDAALRSLEIQQRADAVEKRLAATRERLAVATGRLATSTAGASRAQGLFNDDTRQSLGFTQRLRGQVLSLAAAYFGLFEAINVGQRAITTEIDRQGTMMRLAVANGGDIRAAGEEFGYVREQADRLGQALTPLANQYSKFAIAARGAGVDTETTRQVFEDFTEVATVLQLSQENVEGIFRALEQSMSKGIVQAEELRGQLGDRLPGAFTKLASAIGVTTGELNKLLEEGKVSAKVLPLLGEFMADEVAGQLPEAVDNTRAALARLRTAFDDFLINISQSGLRDAIQAIAEDLTTFFRSTEGQQFAQDIALGFSAIANAARALVPFLGQIVTALKVILAVKIATWFGQFTASIGASILSMRGFVSQIRTAQAATLTFGRVVSAAFGPIGIAIALAAEAFLYFKSKSDAATQAAEAQERQLGELRTASGQALSAAIQLAEADLRAADAARDDAQAKRDQARATLQAANAKIASLKAEGRLTQRYGRNTGNLTPEAREAIAAGQAASQAAAEAQKVLDEYARKSVAVAGAVDRRRRESFRSEMAGMRAIDALQAELGDKRNQERFKTDDKYYNDVTNRAREAYRQIGDAEREQVAQTTLDRQEALQTMLGQLRVARLGVDLTIPEKKKKAGADPEKAAEAAARRREQIAHQVGDKLLDIERDISESRIELEATTVEQVEANLKAKMEAIDAEIKKRIADLEALRDKALREGDTATADKAKAGIGQLDELKAIQQRQAAEEIRQKSIEASEQRVSDIVSRRNAEIELVNIEREAGLKTQAQAENEILGIRERYASSISESVAKVLAMIAALKEFDPQLYEKLNLGAVEAQMRGIRTEANATVSAGDKFIAKWGGDVRQVVDQTFGALAEGLAGLVTGTASLSDAFKAARDAFLSFASDFLIQIGKMILQAIILQAIKNAINGTSGGYAQAAMSAVGAMHTGGMVGSPRHSYREVSPLLFASAPRYHSGGFPGLRSDEVPIIAQRGEEMLSRTDPRNALNGGGVSQAPQVKIVNAIDSASVVTEAMNSREGQSAIINMMSARRQEVKRLLGIGG